MSLVIRGIDDVRRVLGDLMPREAQKLKRQTALALAQDIAKDAKERMPARTGQMKAATKAQSENAGSDFDATVRVGKQAFYWRFLEYGQGPDGVEHAMFLQARQHVMSNFEGRVAEHFKRKLAAAMRRGL